MGTVASLAAALLLSLQQTPPQVPPVSAEQPDQLGEVVVQAVPLSRQMEAFVDDIIAPARGRGLARWRDRLCVGVVNIRSDAAHYIADRVSTVARDLDISVGAPGCQSNLTIIFADDGQALAAAMVEREPGAFRIGRSATDIGSAGLETFMTSQEPVRWWHISLPIDRDTGAVAIKLPGRDPPIFNITGSRLNTQVVDKLTKVIVIVDASRLGDTTLTQLGDYLALISLAQIDPGADNLGRPTILNMFVDPAAPDMLSDWDLGYLKALYGSQLARAGANRQAGDLAGMMWRGQGVGPSPEPTE